MVGKLAAAIILSCAILFTPPAYAASSSEPAPEAAATEAGPSEALEVKSGAAVSSDIDNINLQYLKGFFVDTGKIVASPLHWESTDWLKLGVVLGVTSSLFLIDENVRDFAQSHQSPIASKFAVVGNDMGNALYSLPPIGAFYLYGYLADDSKARRASLLSIESVAISGLLTDGLKMLADRHRPNTGDAPATFDGPSLSLKNVSFSSGHTATAFSIATVFADVYKDNPYVAPLAYSLATLTGLSRIYVNAHWSSDVFFGAALGYFTSKALLSYHKEDTKTIIGNQLTIMPVISKEMNGLTVKYNF